MYLPKHFEVPAAEARRLIEAEPFATLIAHGRSAPSVSHLPLVAAEGEPLRLFGHMARRNPQWEEFRDAPAVVAIFHGPHAYITPNWYAEHDVPTWNYAVVHVEGKVRLIDSPRETLRTLAMQTLRFEGDGPEAWRMRLPEDLAEAGALERAIVGFEIVVERVTAKFKLSQNRSAVDRHRVVDGLATRNDAQSAAVAELMRRFSLD